MLIFLSLALYFLYSNINNTWLLSPPNYVLLLGSVIAFILAMKGFKYKKNLLAKTRSWTTLILSSLLVISLTLTILFTLAASSLGANEHIKTVHSPDGTYQIDFYQWDAGAAGTFGIRGELNGPLWFKKRIYLERRIETVEVEWESNERVLINNHTLNLNDGETYGY
nr:DUF5412 family protein [Paenibacillus bovis]